MKRVPVFLRLAIGVFVTLLPAAAAAATASTCVFLVSMVSGTDVNNLDLFVNYKGADGNVEGSPSQPACARALAGAFAAYRDDDEASRLFAAMGRVESFSAPTPLFGCRIFYDQAPPEPGDFAVTVTNAGRGGVDDSVVPTPVLRVTSVECPGELPVPTTTTTLPVFGVCGAPASGGPEPSASDALFTLRAAVGAAECDPCACDVNGDSNVAASDALSILRAAVGAPVDLDCPPC